MKIEINIDKLLKENDRTLAWLSRKTNISYNALSKIKKWETKKIWFDTMWKILEAFNCDTKTLFKITK